MSSDKWPRCPGNWKQNAAANGGSAANATESANLLTAVQLGVVVLHYR